MHHLDFDFAEATSLLNSSEWLFLKKNAVVDNLSLRCGFSEKPVGIQFSILEIQFYVSEHGGFVPLVDDGSTIVHVLGVV